VRIKAGNIPGVIVAIDTDGGTKPPIYFVEKDDDYKDGLCDHDLIWCDSDEIEVFDAG
jgi:hypothetical protein